MSRRRSPRPDWIRWCIIVAAALPPALAAWIVGVHGVDVPFGDTLDEVPYLVDRWRGGSIAWHDIWVNHNEHRIVIPRLIHLGLALATRWDARWEMWLSMICWTGGFALIVNAAARPSLPVIAALSVLWFSAAHWEVWTCGGNLAFGLCALGAAAAARALVMGPRTDRAVLLALCAAVAMALTLANGLVLPLAVAAGIAVAGGKDLRRRLAGCAGAWGVLVWLYTLDYDQDPGHLDPLAGLTVPGRMAAYSLAYLGAPIGAGRPVAAGIAGAIGLAALVIAIVRVSRSPMGVRAASAPWVLLGAQAVLSALLTGLGRTGLGPAQALASRYSIFATLLWVGVTALWWHVLPAPRKTHFRNLRIGLTALMLAGALLTGRSGWRAAAEQAPGLRESVECARHFRTATDDCLGRLYPVPGIARWRLFTLERLRIGPFAGMSDREIELLRLP